MKTELFKVSGEPKTGDMIVLSYTTPRGGNSNARYAMKGRTVTAEIDGDEVKKVVVAADSPADIVKGLAAAINNSRGDYCPGQFHATGRDDMLIVTCSDAVNDVIFSTHVAGEGTVEFARL
jgi:hypothetical protein